MINFSKIALICCVSLFFCAPVAQPDTLLELINRNTKVYKPFRDCFGFLTQEDYNLWQSLEDAYDHEAKEAFIKTGRVNSIKKNEELYLQNREDLGECVKNVFKQLHSGRLIPIQDDLCTPQFRKRGDIQIYLIHQNNF
jgi:hypothetical protein